MRLALIVLCAFLSGCVTAQQQAAVDWNAINNALVAARDDCFRRFEAGEIETNLGRAQCLNAAEKQIIGDNEIYPDLANILRTARIALATKVDSGELSKADADFQFAQIFAETNSEYQRRNAEERRRFQEVVGIGRALGALP